MKVGDLVTYWYQLSRWQKGQSVNVGLIIEVDKDGVRVKPQAHPRDIVALPQDVKVLVSV